MKVKIWHGALVLIALVLLWTLFGKTREGMDTNTTTPGPVTPIVSTEVVPPAPAIDPRPIPPPLPEVVKAPVPATPAQAMGGQYTLTCTASPVPPTGGVAALTAGVPTWNTVQPPPM